MPEKSHVGMTQCYFCGADKDIVLDLRIRIRDTLERHMGVADMAPCPACADLMKQGVMVIEATEASLLAEDARMTALSPEDRKTTAAMFNPYRTGRMWVLTDDGVRRLLENPQLSQVLKRRFMFLGDDMAERMGFHTIPAT